MSYSHLAESEVIRSEYQAFSRFNGNNILDSSPCGLRVDWSRVRVFSWFALQMNHANQTRKSHEPGITKRHKGSLNGQVFFQGAENAGCKKPGPTAPGSVSRSLRA